MPCWPCSRQGPARIVRNLARVRGSSQEWAAEGTKEDAAWVSRVNGCIDALGRELNTMPRLHGLAGELFEAAFSESRLAQEP